MKKLVCLALCLLMLTGCSGEQTASIFAMDTVMTLTAYGPKAEEALDGAVELVDRLEGELSAQRVGSDIYRLNHAQGEPVVITSETEAVLSGALDLCRITGGALDVTIYPAVEAWGFPSGEYRVPDGAELEALRALVDYEAVELGSGTAISGAAGTSSAARLPDGMKLDLGAVGKGFAADRIVELWRDMGLTSGLLDLGGSIYCMGAKTDGGDWTVAIRDPEDENGYLCTFTGRDIAVVTSGVYQRNFTLDGVFYHHILDPETCMPAASGLTSVTIVAESGLRCDGLATAVYVMGMEDAARLWRQRRDFEMILYTDGGELYVTAGLEGRIVPAEGLTLQVIYG